MFQIKLRKGALKAVVAMAAMVITMLPTQMFAAPTSSRLAGDNRIATAITIADAFGAADTVILAAADDANLVDSLAVAPLAGKASPIYLTNKNFLDTTVKARLSGKYVYVIGAISDAVFNDVKTVASSATRLSGANRLATNDAINAKLANVAGTFVVGFDAIPDALSVASYAAANNYAIVLANPDGTVDSSKLLGSKTYIVGGSALVKDITGATRLSGIDRFATNTSVIDGLNFGFATVYIANGLSLVDALAGSSLAAKTGSPIIITDNNKITTSFNSNLASDSVVTALGGTGAVSEYIISKVTNTNTSNSEISSYVLTNNTSTEFDQTSTTLVVDETAYFSKITVTTDGIRDEITDTDIDSFSVRSSNPAVIDVDEDNHIKAISPGTARITVSYGNFTKVIDFKVVNEERELTKIRFKDYDTNSEITSLKTIVPNGEAKESIIKVEPVDQYGDKMPDEYINCESTNDSIMSVSDESGGNLRVTGIGEGTAFISVRDNNDSKKGSLLVTVSENSEVAYEKFGIYNPIDNDDCDNLVSGTKLKDFSTDATIDISGDAYVVYRLTQYNSDNIYLGVDDTVTSDLRTSKSDVAELLSGPNGEFIVHGQKAGTASLVVKDTESNRTYTAKITIVDEGYSIKSVDFKSLGKVTTPKKLNYKSILNYTLTDDDPIIKGITLYNTVSQNIRLDTNDGQLYVDKDGDGTYSSDDTDLGYLEITTNGDISDSAGSDVDEGISLTYGDVGTVLFKIRNATDDKIIKSTYVSVDI